VFLSIVDDIPQSQSDSQPQPVVKVISPAVLNAEKYKHKPRAIMTMSNSDADFQDVMNRLTKRKVYDTGVVNYY
jgi:hypothetical protein